MLTLQTPGGAVPLHIDDYYIKQLYSGYDELIFSISIYDPEYLLIQEESVIREESDGDPINYLVKAIDGGANTAQIKCQIDLDAWKADFYKDYNSGSHTLIAILGAVKPTGWTVTDHSGKTFMRTIELPGATPLDIVEACRNTFNVTFRFNNIQKTMEIVDPDSYTPIGAFITRDLNLKEINYKGKSTSFATRLYAYGKDGLSFADINNGKPYVENHDYSARVICAYWEDERFTVKQNLLDAAQEKLDEMAVPARSYECSVYDLAAVDPDKYSFLDFSLFAVVTLIDTNRNAGQVNHQVVEVWRYPYAPQNNTVTLSTVAPRIQSQVSQIVYDMTNPNSDYQRQRLAAQLQATADILGAQGGAVRLLDTNDDGYPDTLYIADNPDPDSAVYVWRFNYMGWGASTNGFDGPFDMAATINAGIVADYITAGTMSADRIRGGTLQLGGVNNIAGIITVLDSTGTYGGVISNRGPTFAKGEFTSLLVSYFTLSWNFYDTNFWVGSTTYTYGGVTYHNATMGVYGPFFFRDGNANYSFLTYWPTPIASQTQLEVGASLFLVSHNAGVNGNLTVSGTKNRLVKTKDYGERLLYSYETPSPMFGDVGEGEIGEDGAAYVWLDPIFAETITTDSYQVFLQKYGPGECYVAERKPGFFVVSGTPGLAFGWELKAKQADFDQRRIDTPQNVNAGNTTNYGGNAADYIESIMKGRVNA